MATECIKFSGTDEYFTLSVNNTKTQFTKKSVSDIVDAFGIEHACDMIISCIKHEFGEAQLEDKHKNQLFDFVHSCKSEDKNV